MSQIDQSFLREVMSKFREWLTTEEGLGVIDEREEKDLFFKSDFSKQSVEKSARGRIK